jgi:endo-1,4-beta-xylanase
LVAAPRPPHANGFGPWSEGSNEVKPRPDCDIDAFTDVTKDHPFCPEIKWMADNGVSFGFPNGTYRPLGNVTRGQMAGFIYRLAGSQRGDDPVCTEDPVFTDLEIGDPFCGEIDWMVDEGISTGFDDGTYRPGATLSRAQMAAFLYRLSDSPRGDDPTCEADEFSDVPASHPFCGEIDWMVDSGITGGYPDGTFRPGNTILRQHMAAFIFRYNVLAGLIT